MKTAGMLHISRFHLFLLGLQENYSHSMVAGGLELMS